MKRLSLLFITILCTTTYFLHAQENSDGTYNKDSRKLWGKEYAEKSAKAIFVEFRNGMLNTSYDMRFGKQRNGLGGRIGFGAAPLVNALQVPLEMNYLLGQRKHYIEIGACAIAGIGRSDSPGSKRTFGIGFSVPTLGYRFQHAKGIIGKIGYSPIVYNVKRMHIQHGFYAGFGVAF